MNIEKIIKQISILESMKKDFVKYLVSLKNEYPVYLEKVDKDMQILNVSIKKSKIPTINFYVIEILIKDDIYDKSFSKIILQTKIYKKCHKIYNKVNI